jgi:hypothetical protein
VTSPPDDVLASLAAYRPGSDAEPLDEALIEIEAVLADPDFDTRDEDSRVYVWMLAGSAAILRTELEVCVRTTWTALLPGSTSRSMSSPESNCLSSRKASFLRAIACTDGLSKRGAGREVRK